MLLLQSIRPQCFCLKGLSSEGIGAALFLSEGDLETLNRDSLLFGRLLSGIPFIFRFWT